MVMMDINLAGELDGIRTTEIINEKHKIPVVYLTASSDEETLQKVVGTNPSAYVIKPFNIRELNMVIELAIFKDRKEKELTKLNEQILRAPLAELAEWAASTPEAGKGEAVVVIGPAAPQEAGAAIGEHRLLRALAARLAPGEAAAIAAEVTGQPKRELYRRILRMKETDA
jgi:CheY-like chemotaxis protein